MTIRSITSVVVFFSLSLLLVSCGKSQDDENSSPRAVIPETSQEQSSATEAENEEKPRQLGSTDEFQTALADFDRSTHPGNQLYQDNCATCHAVAATKAPIFNWLEMMSPAKLHHALTEGLMKSQAAHLSDQERLQIVEYIARQNIEKIEDVQPAPLPMCSADAAEFDLSKPPAAVNWGHDTARFSSADVAGLTASDVPTLELKWSFAFPDALRARSQPAIAMGAVFVGSQDGTVYSFDLETGCVRWTFPANAEVRTAIVLQTTDGDVVDPEDPPLAFFGDILARLYAVNALTGELVWATKVDDHPGATLTGSPAYFDGRLYVPVSSLEIIEAANPDYACCTFRGHVRAVEAATGKTIWDHYTIPEEPTVVAQTSLGTDVYAPSGAPVWSSPAIDVKRNRIYFGTGENYSSPAEGNSDAILAVDMDTGERVWTRQSTSGDAWNVACMMENNPNCPEENGPDFDHGSSMILAPLSDGDDILLVGHKNGTIFGLDADNNGDVLWSTKVGRGSIQGGVHWGMAAEGSVLYAPINDMNNTRNGELLDPAAARPGVNALDAATGEVLWSHIQEDLCPERFDYCDPGVSAAATAMPGVVFAGHLDGFIRAYDRETGAVLWAFDTVKDFATVNGLAGKGGSMSASGPAIGDGHVVVNSGYGLYDHAPGNLLLVFAPNKELQ